MFKHKSAVAMLALLGAASWSWGDDVKPSSAAKAPHQWVSVDQDAWAVFLEAPEYHFAKARESLAAKDPRTAAAEIREGAMLLRFQAKRLDAAVSDLNTVAQEVSTGKVTSGDHLDAVLTNANKTLDYREPLVPYAEGTDQMFFDDSQYHITQAKTKLMSKDNAGAAAEIRKAIAFLKLEAAQSRRDVKSGFKSAINDLETLAKKAESGTEVAAKDLDQSFGKARKTISDKL
jgi:hypothetical protein